MGDGQVPYGATPGFDPADPALQSAGGFRSNNGSNVNGTGQSDGPEETRDRIGALAINLSRSFDSPFFSAVKFGGRVSDRRKTHHSNRWGLCAGTGSTTFATPNDPNSQACPAGTGVVSLANAGLEAFNVPSFTAPPMVYGNFDSLRALLYPNDAAPAGSELLLVHTTVKEKSYEGYVQLDFKTSVFDRSLTGGLGVRIAHVNTESPGFRPPTEAITRRCRFRTTTRMYFPA